MPKQKHQKKKWVSQTSSKLKPFVLQMTPSKKQDDNPQNGRKTFQII